MGLYEFAYRCNKGTTGSYQEIEHYNGKTPTWYLKSWWASYEYVKKWTNDLGVPAKLSSVSISSCAGHSGGKPFCSTGGPNNYVYGTGSTYHAKVVVGNQSSSIADVDVPTITHFNCSYGYYGGTDNTTPNTPFGRIPPCDESNGISTKTFSIQNCPIVQPGESAYIHISVDSWKDDNNALLVIKCDGEGTQVEVDPGQDGYIWRFNENKKWEIIRPYYVYTSQGWKSVEELDK